MNLILPAPKRTKLEEQPAPSGAVRVTRLPNTSGHHAEITRILNAKQLGEAISTALPAVTSLYVSTCGMVKFDLPPGPPHVDGVDVDPFAGMDTASKGALMSITSLTIDDAISLALAAVLPGVTTLTLTKPFDEENVWILGRFLTSFKNLRELRLGSTKCNASVVHRAPGRADPAAVEGAVAGPSCCFCRSPSVPSRRLSVVVPWKKDLSHSQLRRL
jgi:hypothetical protein